MNGPQHYDMAEKLLENAAYERREEGDIGLAQDMVATAQVHALLAQTAATISAAYGDMSMDKAEQWTEVLDA